MRRQFVTHPTFQISFTCAFLVGVFLIYFFIGGSTLLTLHWLGQDPLVTEAQRNILRVNIKEFSIYLIYLTVFSMLVMGWVAFYLSYKFVGPLVRLENWLQDRLERKDSELIQLRPGDEMEPLSIALNRIVLKIMGPKGEPQE